MVLLCLKYRMVSLAFCGPHVKFLLKDPGQSLNTWGRLPAESDRLSGVRPSCTRLVAAGAVGAGVLAGRLHALKSLRAPGLRDGRGSPAKVEETA